MFLLGRRKGQPPARFRAGQKSRCEKLEAPLGDCFQLRADDEQTGRFSRFQADSDDVIQKSALGEAVVQDCGRMAMTIRRKRTLNATFPVDPPRVPSLSPEPGFRENHLFAEVVAIYPPD